MDRLEISSEQSGDYDEAIERLFPKCRPKRGFKKSTTVQNMEETVKSEETSRISSSGSLPILSTSLKGDEVKLNNLFVTRDVDKRDGFDENEHTRDSILHSNIMSDSDDEDDDDDDDDDERSSDDKFVIGNLPIAKYKTSPRRYVPRNVLSAKERNQSESRKEPVKQTYRFVPKAQPGYPLRLYSSEETESHDKSGETTSFPYPKVFPNKLVKSILAIPEPSSTLHDSLSDARIFDDDGSHSPDASSLSFMENHHSKERAKLSPFSLAGNNNSINSNNNNLSERLQSNGSDDSSIDQYPMNENVPGKYLNDTRPDFLSSPLKDGKRSSDSVSTPSSVTRKKECLSNFSSNKKPLPQMSTRPSHFISDYLVPKETNIDDICHDLHNFSPSPEVTDCDSEEIESEFSIEGSLHPSSRYNKMPVLEDGLSTGVPSLDNELDDDTYDDVSFPLDSTASPRHERDKQPLNRDTHRSNTCQENANTHSDPLGCRNHHSLSESPATERSSRHKNSINSSCLKTIDLSFDPRPDHETTAAGYPGTCERKSETKIDGSFGHNRSYQNDSQGCVNSMGGSNNLNFPRSERPGQITRKSVNSTCNKPPYVEDNSRRDDERSHFSEDCDTDQETDRLLGAQRAEEKNHYEEKSNGLSRKKNSSREILIEGVLFRARYLGSCQLVCEGQPTKATRMMQAEEAVSRIKDPDGENQPRPEVDLFISTEKIMVLNTDLKEIMMDHALRSISYIADIGDLLVLMTRRKIANSPDDASDGRIKRIPKMTCHVFESEEAQFIAQSIGQAFQVAFMEFLKANGIEDSGFVKEMDYQEVLNSQEILGNELEMFARKDRRKEVIVPKQKKEKMGMVIVESGWGSMLPTVVIANMSQNGPAARCGHLNVGDQIIAINGISLVGLPLATCQNYIKSTKYLEAVKLTVVPCPPVVEVKIKRPDTKYQLGFSVQNGVICSLLRGGIAERGGVRVGHRIIEINEQSVVAVPHERIVNLLATSVGEITMKTMPTAMFRLLTGQESPVFI
ncbi:uncharacterized protein LOC141852045 isoform X2 [Brevipalpus obovatus]|uniref:uncharacterized protein LOC141852045 isoform X2 n=1 Tax=Brevipalpus obovatus TaxID=246614 RepID=UPI003D9DD86D